MSTFPSKEYGLNAVRPVPCAVILAVSTVDPVELSIVTVTLDTSSYAVNVPTGVIVGFTLICVARVRQHTTFVSFVAHPRNPRLPTLLKYLWHSANSAPYPLGTYGVATLPFSSLAHLKVFSPAFKRMDIVKTPPLLSTKRNLPKSVVYSACVVDAANACVYTVSALSHSWNTKSWPSVIFSIFCRIPDSVVAVILMPSDTTATVAVDAISHLSIQYVPAPL